MEGFTYVQLRTNLKMLQEIKNFYLVQAVGQHTRCVVTGIIDEDYKTSYINEMNAEEELEIFLEEGMTLFKGLIEEVGVTHVGGLYKVTIKGVSYSYMLDTRRTSRSFQDKDMTYEQLVADVVHAYPKGDIIDKVSEGAVLNQLIVQYQETDWAFLKRLASHFNKTILPISTYTGAKLIFGDNRGVDRGRLETYDFSVSKDLKRYKEASENTFKAFDEQDAVTFSIDTLEHFEIGDQVNYQKRKLYIHTKEIAIEDGLLHFRYKLSSKKGMGEAKLFNEQIKGVSLKGKVLEVVRDHIKVHLEIDASQDPQKAWLFPYTTSYTAEGQSGWYAMPEIGDTVYIYFPSHKEDEAMGLNALRIGDKQTDKIDSPEIKYFRTINGKELKFAPDELVITCINGKDPITKEEKIIYIKLNDQTGIEIMSTEPILFKSDKNIKFEAEERMEIIAKKEIKLKCKQSEIRMDTMVDICGPEVRIN